MISFQNYKKYYGKKLVIKADEVSFPDGRISFLMGPNGSGKTTTIKCICHLEDYDGVIENNTATDIFVVWDDTPFYTRLSGLKNLFLLCEEKLSNVEITKHAEMYMSKSLLRRKVKTYSYGQKKLLALIAAQIIHPKVLILDEISNGLDYETLIKTKEYLKTIASDTLVILTGHQLSFYNDIVEDLFIIKDSEIKQYKDFEYGLKDLGEIYREEILA